MFLNKHACTKHNYVGMHFVYSYVCTYILTGTTDFPCHNTKCIYTFVRIYVCTYVRTYVYTFCVSLDAKYYFLLSCYKYKQFIINVNYAFHLQWCMYSV